MGYADIGHAHIGYARIRYGRMGRVCLNAAGAFALFGFAMLAPSASAARDTVHLSGYSAGTIVVKTSQLRLDYFVESDTAIQYPVGVGKAGMAWSGTAYIKGKYLKPAWSPPAIIRRENPRIANVIASGSSANPMGAAAMTLSAGQYAIHGTNNPGSIGGFVSHGCIRMLNSDILDLYERVGVGTKVVMLP
jgi:lipoprotein-anchoring transpeptidase ErfK/SrfK